MKYIFKNSRFKPVNPSKLREYSLKQQCTCSLSAADQAEMKMKHISMLEFNHEQTTANSTSNQPPS